MSRTNQDAKRHEEDEAREEQEEAREFLLRSLDDLEAERDAENIDDATYARLHGDYTARAAAVLRALDGEAVELSAAAAPPVSATRRAVVIGGLIAFAVAAAVTLAITIGPRLPGQTVTGGVVSDPKAAIAALKTAVRDRPDDYSARIEYARSLLDSDRVEALRQYGAAARLRPKEPEPPTYVGWILGLASNQVTDAPTRTQLIDRALREFARARSLDSRYPDSYVFEGLVRDRFANDPVKAVPLFRQYLTLAPDGPQAELVRSALSDAQKRAAASSTTTTTK
jgi:tetratricopeptide (TPR) repeat protein